MTINDIVWLMRSTERYQRGVTKPEHPNGAAVSHPDMPDDGLDITGMTAVDHMKRYYGMSGTGNELGDTIRSYYKQIPPSDRANAAWTLQQIHREEVYRLYDFVRSRVPGWQIGQKFDTSILDEYPRGVDVKA